MIIAMWQKSRDSSGLSPLLMRLFLWLTMSDPKFRSIPLRKGNIMPKSILLVLAFTILAIVVSLGARETQHKTQAASTSSVSDGEFVVHEWGTFTTFSGSDGAFLDFRPLAAGHSDLPDYVLDRLSLSPKLAVAQQLSKNRLRGRVRMETPVTYFYSDRIRTVDVSVDFPEGLLTEFYPPVREVLPAIDDANILGKGELIGNSSLNWGSVDIIPVSEFAKNIPNKALNEVITSRTVRSLVPHAANEQHYASARETDSAIVHVRNQKDTESHFEKFLFYRGVGKFQLPITTHFVNNQAVVSNGGALPITSCILIDINGDLIQAAKVERVEADQSVSFAGLQSMPLEQLASMVQQSLIAEGLYEKEATSMVETWKQSWFTENGTRVLYMLPGTTTDQLLPLHITPKPHSMLRVLVGRMEIMSPASEQAMIRAVSDSYTSRLAHHTRNSESQSNEAYSVPKAIIQFGRMAEPALARIMSLTSDVSIQREAEMLLKQIQSM
jgi:hypothetical protein